MFFYCLLAGHLLGDFALQTNKIAIKKNVEIKWTLIHSMIITFSMLIFTVPFDYRSLGIVLLNGSAHFVIDYYKPRFKNPTPQKNFVYFIMDQSAHITLIYLSALLLPTKSTIWGSQFIYLLLTLLFVISLASVFIQFLIKMLFELESKEFYRNNEKALGNMTRAFMFLLLYLSYYSSPYFIGVGLILLIGLVLYYKIKLSAWMTLNYLIAKLLLDGVFVTVAWMFYIGMID